MADWKSYSKDNPEDTPSSTTSTTKTASRSTVWILSGLLAVAVIIAVLLGIKASNFEGRSTDLATQLDETRTSLESEYAELETTYHEQVTENEGLSSEIQVKVKEVEELQTRIKQMRGQLASSKSNAEEIRQKLAALEELKTELEGEITGLKEENEQLATTNTELSSSLEASNTEIDRLSNQVAQLTESNEAMHRRLTILAPAGYRADNFAIQVQKRNDRLTTKARRADEVHVSFDLDNVPTDKQGNSQIYLAITTFQGNPVTSIPVSTVSVESVNEPLQIQAADAQEVSLEASQRVDMSFKLDKDLDAGEYNLLVYSDAGYLGSTGFRLR